MISIMHACLEPTIQLQVPETSALALLAARVPIHPLLVPRTSALVRLCHVPREVTAPVMASVIPVPREVTILVLGRLRVSYAEWERTILAPAPLATSFVC